MKLSQAERQEDCFVTHNFRKSQKQSRIKHSLSVTSGAEHLANLVISLMNVYFKIAFGENPLCIVKVLNIKSIIWYTGNIPILLIYTGRCIM